MPSIAVAAWVALPSLATKTLARAKMTINRNANFKKEKGRKESIRRRGRLRLKGAVA